MCMRLISEVSNSPVILIWFQDFIGSSLLCLSKLFFSLMQERGFNHDPAANLVVGLTFSQLWYSGIPKELQLTELDSSDSYMQSEHPIDAMHQPIDYSMEDNPHEVGGDNSAIRHCSNTSVAIDKEVAEDDSDQDTNSMATETNVKKETSYSSHERQDSFEKPEAVGVSGSSLSNNSNDVPRVSIYQTQGKLQCPSFSYICQ